MGEEPIAGPVDRLVGARIRERREAMGFTPAALAARLSCSPEHVLDLEAGRAHASAATLERLTHLCGVDLGYFLADVAAVRRRPLKADQTSSSS